MNVYTIRVPIGPSGAHFIENPMADPGLEWLLRYAHPNDLNEPKNSALLSAASVLASTNYLCSDAISMKEATRRLRLMRAAWKDSVRQTVT